ncbi:hypothetical protein CEXT_623651 [Caerostris extrusa]|uniref:Uncharacterized protein n=1 Tax=Caerostris extrusa TaxID=172846 RepID=A0AAV4PLA1_CAEEX|nr:hypothetical protein CEXT_623651 [Caerostris extrusa]
MHSFNTTCRVVERLSVHCSLARAMNRQTVAARRHLFVHREQAVPRVHLHWRGAIHLLPSAHYVAHCFWPLGNVYFLFYLRYKKEIESSSNRSSQKRG